ncbi:MAG: ABC transporter ATP-binding protein [Ndongobacter sp.]|nr:ABC transporter ATP-binding protein [Ndongobacter sp.]
MSELLKIETLSKHFGGVKAINGFQLTLDEGKIYGLIGPNGAGKTTIFNVITGIYEPTEGRILFQGADISGKKPQDIAKMGIGRTFQNIRLFTKLSALQNVLLANHGLLSYGLFESTFRTKKFRSEEQKAIENARYLLETVGLSEYEKSIAGSLPYGHQRKLEIARALALNPKLLLLDEPAAGMNVEESIGLVRFIQQIKERFDVTILMIEHHMDVVFNLCDECTVLNFGTTIASGTPDEIKKNPEVIRAYLGEEAVEHAEGK